MKTLKYKTISANRETVNKQWFVVDAEGEILGRLAAKVALVLRGKHKTDYTPHVDCGDNVIIINAEKIQLTGNKLNDKVYISHSGYPGGQKTIPIKKMLENNPERVLEKAIKGMLPKNSLGDQLFRNLYIYVGNEHKQEAQKPAKLDLNTIK
ncbi:MAG: 50S ribosomal protein L13 [Bacteroidales bacterium]|nr:50S ribosomal protein L13 [Bacteroidales bacterium]MDD3858985.1 50S ribosomal protein L13 [Bacteroidales bacterium]